MDLGKKLVWISLKSQGNMHYLIVVDYYSNFIEIGLLTSQTSTRITVLKKHFARHGIPRVIVSDGGPNLPVKSLTYS